MLVLSGCNAQATTSPSMTSVAHAEFTAAKGQWVLGSKAPSFRTSAYLRSAATDLSRGLDSAGSSVVRYKKAISELRQLASIPETSDSAQQKSEAHRDLVALNLFFATKGLYE
jgi:uncharacterized protein YfiM (DUF2279 family)